MRRSSFEYIQIKVRIIHIIFLFTVRIDKELHSKSSNEGPGQNVDYFGYLRLSFSSFFISFLTEFGNNFCAKDNRWCLLQFFNTQKEAFHSLLGNVSICPLICDLKTSNK